MSLVTGLMALAGPARAARTFWVHPGQSIQAAVDHAAPGDTVVVLKGVYPEMVQVRTDYLTLRGRHAVIVPPSQVPDTACAPFTTAGICLLAKDGDPPSGVVTTPVVGNTIQGFTLRGFSGDAIYTFGAHDALIKHDRVFASDVGILSRNSSGTRFIDNVFAHDRDGIHLDNIGGGRDMDPPPLPDANALIHGNYFHANGNGVDVVNTSVGTIRGNEFAGNGGGISFRAGFSGTVKTWTIKWNWIHDNGTGIWLEGVRYFRIVHNRVVDSYGNGSVYSGGLVLTSSTDYDFGDSSTNVIEHNTFLRNQVLDIYWPDAIGGQTDQTIFADNLCERSLPESLCS
jgi:nitrous oxidase accessory protein NosD